MIKYCVEPANEESLRAYGAVTTSFLVTSRVDIDALRGGAPNLVTIPTAPWTKNYDELESPSEWADRFDVKRWHLISARDGIERVGGAIVAHDTPGVDMLEGRRDLAVVWDIRVGPPYRGQGIGRALFLACIKLSRSLGCTDLKVETQDINVAACHLYSSLGCRAATVAPGAYDELPDETMILWRMPLR